MRLDRAGEASLLGAPVLDVADRARQQPVAVVALGEQPLRVELVVADRAVRRERSREAGLEAVGADEVGGRVVERRAAAAGRSVRCAMSM